MIDGGEQLIGCFDQGVRPGLQLPAAALSDLGCSLGQLSKEGATFARTLPAVPKQMFAVTSSRIQSQMASSGLKSGL